MTAGDWIVGMTLVLFAGTTILAVAVAWHLSLTVTMLQGRRREANRILSETHSFLANQMTWGSFKNGTVYNGVDEGDYVAGGVMEDIRFHLMEEDEIDAQRKHFDSPEEK